MATVQLEDELAHSHDDDFTSDLVPWWRDNHVWLKNVVVGPRGPIMTQFTLIAVLGFHLRLHIFHCGDGDFFHSHTRSFASIGLCGAYRERLCASGEERVVRPGTITLREASLLHNVEPFRFPCVTLAITTPNIRAWEKRRC